MNDIRTISPIAYIKNSFCSKFAVPRQSGIANSVISKIVFEKEFRSDDFIRGLEGFSHIWILWGFSHVEDRFSATVRPPRLGGNKRIGVFASRSPYRPNHIGLSSVKIESIEKECGLGNVIYVSGADIVDGTPIYDIKPYLSFTDSHPDAICGYTKETEFSELDVVFLENYDQCITEADKIQLREILTQDPRPSYHDSENKKYSFEYGKYTVTFSVCDKTLTVEKIKAL